jgi:hypothetical protein
MNVHRGARSRSSADPVKRAGGALRGGQPHPEPATRLTVLIRDLNSGRKDLVGLLQERRSSCIQGRRVGEADDV